MRIVIFGLSVTSAWGNGHATLWRGLLRALARRRNTVTFFEKDVPWYASYRDLTEIPGVNLVLYSNWESVRAEAATAVRNCDAAIVTSYCPDSQSATDLLGEYETTRIFYDLDAPVTLDRVRRGEQVEYVPRDGYAAFDLVMSYTGGRALADLRSMLGARNVVPIYGSVDPAVHRPVTPVERWRGDLSYLGTWAADRQEGVNRLLVEPARRSPNLRFMIGGAMYDQTFPWTDNIFFNPHIAPMEHSAFYCSSRVTLNVTRAAMAAYGYCPSGRLFEAAACGVPVVSDLWEGLDQFFQPGGEILVAGSADDVLKGLARDEVDLRAIGHRARERTLDLHTAGHRAIEFENAIENAASGKQHPLHAGA